MFVYIVKFYSFQFLMNWQREQFWRYPHKRVVLWAISHYAFDLVNLSTSLKGGGHVCSNLLKYYFNTHPSPDLAFCRLTTRRQLYWIVAGLPPSFTITCWVLLLFSVKAFRTLLLPLLSTRSLNDVTVWLHSPQAQSGSFSMHAWYWINQEKS